MSKYLSVMKDKTKRLTSLLSTYGWSEKESAMPVMKIDDIAVYE